LLNDIKIFDNQFDYRKFSLNKEKILIMKKIFAIVILLVPGISYGAKNDLLCLARNIYYEARGESLTGKIAVANVTINRVKKRNKENEKKTTICKVVYEKHQFSWTNLPKPKKIDDEAWDDALTIAKSVLNGKFRDVTNKSTHYHSVKIKPKWASSHKIKKVKVIGKHVFYKLAENPKDKKRES
jgi:N-acetylmuramoyl-L-alanine amidase